MDVSARAATCNTLVRERGDVRNLELDGDGCPLVGFLCAFWSPAHQQHALFDKGCTSPGRTSSHTRQAKVSSHHQVLATGQLLDPPHERRLFRNIVHGPDCGAELGRVGVFGDGDVDLDVVSGRPALELRLDLCVAQALGSEAGSSEEAEKVSNRAGKKRGLLARTLTMYSIRLPECCSMSASAQINGLTWVLSRYDMSSNSPSGGMNEMVRSFSNRDRRTHWWNFTSSISIALPREASGTWCQRQQSQTRSE